jgi:hypothetical protein
LYSVIITKQQYNSRNNGIITPLLEYENSMFTDNMNSSITNKELLKNLEDLLKYFSPKSIAIMLIKLKRI